MYQVKKTEGCTHVGVFCEVIRGKSQNQRWSVYFMGKFLARFNTKNQALQFAEHRIWAAMKDMVALGGMD